MRLLSLAEEARISGPGARSPSSADPAFRGVSVYWATEALPARGSRRRKFAPTVPVPTWGSFRVAYRHLRPDGADDGPSSGIEADLMVRSAFAIAASHHPIPSDAVVYYEFGPCD